MADTPHCFGFYDGAQIMLRECDDCPYQLACMERDKPSSAVPEPLPSPVASTRPNSTDMAGGGDDRPIGGGERGMSTGHMDIPLTYDLEEMSENIVSWADRLIPGRSPEKAFEKLIEEIEEWSKRPADGHEAADVMIVFLDLCHLAGIDIAKAVHWKMRINTGRTWTIDENGVLQHVR